MATKRVFINYRREDSAPYALALRAEFERHLAGAHVFVDTQGIAAGTQWPAVLKDALFQTDALISLIGPDWISAAGADGRLRLFDEEDWVRRELAYMLEHALGSVVPVLVGGASAPSSQMLPDNLKKLPDIQCRRLETEHRDENVDALIDILSDRFGFQIAVDKFDYPRPDDFVKGTPSVTSQRLEQAMASPQLKGWSVEGTDNPRAPDRMWLCRIFKFKGFDQAMQFMNDVAQYCRTVDHHPRWENVHREVSVRLSTFDAGFKITEMDLQLAVEMNRAAARITQH